MGKIHSVRPVKLICGIIAVDENVLSLASEELRRAFGDTDSQSDIIPFDFTDYYEREMGKDLLRRFVTFRDLVDPGLLPDIKISTNEIERAIAGESDCSPGRPVNLDPGYVSESKLVLASVKNFAHRVYLRDGVYAEVTLHFKKEGAVHHEWTFPDFRTDKYKRFFEDVRVAYRAQLQAQ